MSSLTYRSVREKQTKDAILGEYSGRDWSHSNGTALNDLALTMTHNYHDRTTHFIFECSSDLYEEATISLLTPRFQHFLSQIFSANFENIPFNPSLEPISKLSTLLPEDVEEIQRTIFRRLPSVADTGMTFIKFSDYFHMTESGNDRFFRLSYSVFFEIGLLKSVKI